VTTGYISYMNRIHVLCFLFDSLIAHGTNESKEDGLSSFFLKTAWLLLRAPAKSLIGGSIKRGLVNFLIYFIRIAKRIEIEFVLICESIG
jgi:hypothetical protein